MGWATASVSGMKVMSRLKHKEVKPLHTVSWISGKKKLTEIYKIGHQEESSAQSLGYLQKGSFKSWKDKCVKYRRKQWKKKSEMDISAGAHLG